FFFQAEDGIRDFHVTGVQTCALPISNRLNPLKHIHHYRMKFPNPRWITKSAFPLDRILLHQTTKDEWEKVAIEVVNQLNNEVIDEAFKQLPAPVYEQYTTDIVNILKSR